jgi:glycosyltransferase involved in cell wall biosynthesis
MRILHVLGKLDRGGVETWLVQVLRHIDRKKYQMDFLVHTEDPGAYDEEVRALGARIIPCLRPSSPVQYALRFRRILREYGPYDVVHSHVHHFSGYVLMLAAAAGVPVRIAHSHSDTRRNQAAASLTRKGYATTMMGLIEKFSTCSLAVSTEAGDALFSPGWLHSPRHKLCHLGIDLSRFAFDVDEESVRRSLGIPRDALVVGHVGRFTEEKNHEFIVKIARELFSQEPRAFFVLVGEGPLRRAIEAKVADCGLSERFLFTGLRADVPTLMKGAMDVFLFPSKREGLPMALLEAQAAGLGCLIADVISAEAGAISELIRLESLGHTPIQWASCLLQLLYEQNPIPQHRIHDALASRSILTSKNNLAILYAESLTV